MKLEKKHWIIIGVVIAIIAVWYFFLRKKKVESGYAGMYGSFGNESGYNARLDKNLLMIGENGYVGQKPDKYTHTQFPGSASKISCPKGWSMMGGRCAPDGAVSAKITPPYSPMNPNPKGGGAYRIGDNGPAAKITKK